MFQTQIEHKSVRHQPIRIEFISLSTQSQKQTSTKMTMDRKKQRNNHVVTMVDEF